MTLLELLLVAWKEVFEMLCVLFYIYYYWCLRMKLIKITELIAPGWDRRRWRPLVKQPALPYRSRKLWFQLSTITHHLWGSWAMACLPADHPHHSHEDRRELTSKLVPKGFFLFPQRIRFESSARNRNVGVPFSKSSIQKIKRDWWRQISAEISVGIWLNDPHKWLQRSQSSWRCDTKFTDLSQLLGHNSKFLNLEKTWHSC